MSVLKRFRTQAKLEFFTNAQKLRRDFFMLMARDFGIKKGVRTVEFITKDMQPEDQQMFLAIVNKYGFTRFDTEYPQWIIEKFRDSLWQLTRELLLNLTAANSIYAFDFREAQERRLFQDKAIGNCEQILKELEFIIDVFPVATKKYTPYIQLVEKEISLIKGWRKSDNKRFNDLRNENANTATL
ncbi:hypothetical protein [uncultured Succinivibrio sp.]|uniref:hypothetical protein n=1 Tax=uncultured Succinivibrio sp. TaxID=540749 RepID=UPI0025EA57E7|nr:hypothetical protein [uncultured Succinivibrio sp.]